MLKKRKLAQLVQGIPISIGRVTELDPIHRISNPVFPTLNENLTFFELNY